MLLLQLYLFILVLCSSTSGIRRRRSLFSIRDPDTFSDLVRHAGAGVSNQLLPI